MEHRLQNAGSYEDRLRIIQESVPGCQITLAHVISNPKPVIYEKLGLDPKGDYGSASIGIMTMSPGEMAIIGGDIATKASNISIGFIDRFSGSLIITGTTSNVEATLKAVLSYAEYTLHFAVCPITRT